MLARYIVILLFMPALVGCGLGSNGNQYSSKSTLVANDQTLDLYTQVTVEELVLDQAAFVVVFDSDHLGRAVNVLGTKYYVESGTYALETIILDKPVADEDQLHIVLYRDADGDKLFDITIDERFYDDSARDIMASIKVNESSQTVHAKLRLSANGQSSYIWSKIVDDADLVGIDSSSSTGPAIRFTAETRIQIINELPSQHPLMFLNADGASVINQGNSNSIVFLVDEDFQNNVVSYQCRAHSTMIGDVSVE